MSVPKQKPGSSKQDYATPHIFLDAVHAKLGIEEFGWDLAASEDNTVSPIGYYSEAQNALVKNWTEVSKGWLWLNPPFSDIDPWAHKSWLSSLDGAKIALLVPASVGSNWFKKYCWNKAFVLYLNGRLAFIPDKPNWLYPKDCMLVLYNNWAVGSDIWRWKVDAG